MLVQLPQLLGDILYPILGQLRSGGCQLNAILTVSDSESLVILMSLMLRGGERGSVCTTCKDNIIRNGLC